MSKIDLGNPWPLGSSITTEGVNFSIAAPNASLLELLIFENEDDIEPIESIKLGKEHLSGDYWHVEVYGLKEGCFYCYKVTTEKDEDNHLSGQILLDPCARAIGGWKCYSRNLKGESTSKKLNFLKGIVSERDDFNFKSHPRPRHKWNKTIIYELHVGGFTNNSDAELDSQHRGTFIGLKEKIPYLKSIGITAIELLPVFAFDAQDAPNGLANYWGYSPINWFTPHYEYCTNRDPLEARNEFRDLVETCHDNDLEVIIDVVYNHTTEEGQNGPIISWKGFGQSIYYHQDSKGNFQDVSGCGNTIAANRPIVRKLIIESIKCWANELGVDGFRFDLGIALSRGENLKPLENPPLFEEIEAEPSLSNLKLISEPWDCGGLYRLSDFPAKRIATWNGHFRDDLRRFWKGDKGSTWPIKDRLTGNSNLYLNRQNPTEHSINFITSHDGFTLNDLVNFDIKHNLANGENNRDGENHNNSSNYGIEGPCSDLKINMIRNKQKRNLLSVLLLSPGIPMILMGDEVGRSQGGNNNSWCQNSPLGWMIWHPDNCDFNLQLFFKKLVSIRQSLPEFFSPEKLFTNKENSSNKLWVEWHGIKVTKPDWSDWSHTISYSINVGNEGAGIWLGLNAYKESMEFELPKAKSPWTKILDTSCLSSETIQKKATSNQLNVQIESKSLVLMIANEYCSKIKP